MGEGEAETENSAHPGGGRVPSRGKTVCRPTFRRKPETVPNGALHYRQNLFLMGLRCAF